MKASISWFFCLLFCLFCTQAVAADSQAAAKRKIHAAQLAERFGQVFEDSRREAIALASRSSMPFDSTQGVGICGDSVLDGGEQCDDGNGDAGDGCSASCQIEGGYNCTVPVPVNTNNLIVDPGFEGGPFSGFWLESSTTLGTPICDVNDCGLDGQRSGSYWAWFGGVDGLEEEASLSQQILIPDTATELRFWLAVPSCHSTADFIEVLIDDSQVWITLGDDAMCGNATYVEQVVDISTWADNAVHTIEFHGKTDTPLGEFTDFFIDDVSLAQGPLVPVPSVCTVEELIFLDGFEAP